MEIIPLFSVFIIGIFFGFGISFIFWKIQSRNTKKLAQEREEVIEDVKASFGNLAFDALKNSIDQFFTVAKERFESERIIHAQELDSKKSLIDQQLHRMITELENVSKIVRSGDYLEVISNKGDSYKTKLAVLATGSTGFELQRSCGFNTPDRYLGIYTHLTGDESKIEEQMVQNYVFHINQKISTNGPFYLVRGQDRVNVGYLGNSKETPGELVSKLNRIVENYKRVQPYIKGLKQESKPVIRYISKHPIDNFSLDRMMVLGEAAGLVTAFFYEGMLCGVCSADIAANIIRPLLERNSKFTKREAIIR